MPKSLFSTPTNNSGSYPVTRTAVISCAVHALIAAAIGFGLHQRPGWVAPYRLPGSPKGSNMVVAYLPDRAPEQSALAQKAEQKPKDNPLMPPIAKRVAAATAPATENTHASPDPNASSGADALGSGDITIALTSYFPAPRPDLSGLPQGTRRDVILDVTIGVDGRISDLKLLTGLGHSVDDTVIATVQQWVFHPALQNGRPVASEQELHFHYARG
jgi:protein TonB